VHPHYVSCLVCHCLYAPTPPAAAAAAAVAAVASVASHHPTHPPSNSQQSARCSIYHCRTTAEVTFENVILLLSCTDVLAVSPFVES